LSIEQILGLGKQKKSALSVGRPGITVPVLVFLPFFFFLFFLFFLFFWIEQWRVSGARQIHVDRRRRMIDRKSYLTFGWGVHSDRLGGMGGMIMMMLMMIQGRLMGRVALAGWLATGEARAASWGERRSQKDLFDPGPGTRTKTAIARDRLLQRRARSRVGTSRGLKLHI
jgi:hypothetical protein